jgi:hypothetical protein
MNLAIRSIVANGLAYQAQRRDERQKPDAQRKSLGEIMGDWRQSCLFGANLDRAVAGAGLALAGKYVKPRH